MSSWCSWCHRAPGTTTLLWTPTEVQMSITIDELAGLAPRPGKGPTAHFTITPAAEPERAEVDGVLAGVAQVDITPPPGMPKAGFSKNAHDGIGFRNRLRARVLHLRSGTG